MEKVEITPDSLMGEWDWRDISVCVSRGWDILSKMCKGEHVWRFGSDGIMTSKENGRMKYVVRYRFDHEKLRLILNGHQVNNEGEPHTLIQELYRVDFTTPSELILYDLEDVILGMEKESLRLRFRRISES